MLELAARLRRLTPPALAAGLRTLGCGPVKIADFLTSRNGSSNRRRSPLQHAPSPAQSSAFCEQLPRHPEPERHCSPRWARCCTSTEQGQKQAQAQQRSAHAWKTHCCCSHTLTVRTMMSTCTPGFAPIFRMARSCQPCANCSHHRLPFSSRRTMLIEASSHAGPHTSHTPHSLPSPSYSAPSAPVPHAASARAASHSRMLADWPTRAAWTSTAYPLCWPARQTQRWWPAKVRSEE